MILKKTAYIECKTLTEINELLESFYNKIYKKDSHPKKVLQQHFVQSHLPVIFVFDIYPMYENSELLKFEYKYFLSSISKEQFLEQNTLPIIFTNLDTFKML